MSEEYLHHRGAQFRSRVGVILYDEVPCVMRVIYL